jgi:hypothetical protein
MTYKQMRLCDKMKDLSQSKTGEGWLRSKIRHAQWRHRRPPAFTCYIYNALGCCYESMRQYRKAIALHEEHKKIAEEEEVRAGVGRAYGDLGNCYEGMGQYRKTIALLHQERKKIAEEVVDRGGVLGACGDLCRCYAQEGKLDQALTYGSQTYQLSREVQLRKKEIKAALVVGSVLRLALRAHRRGQASHGLAWPSVRQGGMRCSVQPLVSVGVYEWQSGGGGEVAAPESPSRAFGSRRTCSCLVSTLIWGGRRRLLLISSSTSRGMCRKHVVCARGAGKCGARTRQC